MRDRVLVVLGALMLLASVGAGTVAAQDERRSQSAAQQRAEKLLRSDAIDTALDTGPAGEVARDPEDAQHGTSDGHLPAARKNVKLVSRLKLTNVPNGIADVQYYKGFAYLAAWSPECPNGGVHVVDVRDPRRPKKVGFLPAGPNDYVGEGIHAIHIENKNFKGDVLLVNNEACNENGREGISLWDVTNPRRPWLLAKHAGDFDVFGEPFANSVHSVLGWTAKKQRKAYAVYSDNYEAGSTDVDIMDISDPGRPKLIAETGFPDWEGQVEVDANGDESFHHDAWFKRIDGKDVLGVSYWDAGWVFLNVENPANPRFIYDTNYPEQDLLGFSPPEGNAHQGEWSKDGRYWLGTDEDFSPYRSKYEITTGAAAGEYKGAEFGWTVPIVENYPDDEKVEGTTVWGGSGCPEDTDDNGISDRDEVPDAADYDAQYAEGEERILVLTRGACFFSEKVESGELHGWDVVIVGNHHAGSNDGAAPDSYLCGSKGHEYEPTVSGGCTGHRAMHILFNDEPAYGEEDYQGADMPPIGTVGEDLRVTSLYDGWGYLNQFNYKTGRHIDEFAAAPALNPNLASGSGDLSVHEIATDLRKKHDDLGYLSWYSAGLYVVSFDRDGIRRRGVYRNTAGNNFWGVSLQKRRGKRPLIHMSDMDSGLWTFKYTGRE